MSYTKQNFKNGQKLMAEELNKMDAALERVANQFPTLSSQDFGKQLYVNETGDGFMLLGNSETIKWNLLEKAEGYRPGYVDGADMDGNGVYWQASSFITYFNIPVTAGTTYYLGGPENKNQYRARFVNWQKEPYTLDAEYKITMTNAEIKAATISTQGPQTAENYVAPTGAKYCTISFYDISQAGTETNYLTTISRVEDRVDLYKPTDIIVASSGKWNMLTEEGVRSGNIYINGTAGTTGSFYTVYNLPVQSGKKYYIGPAFNGQYARFVNWTKSPYLLNEDGSVAMSSDEIKAVTLATVGATRQEEHTAATGAKYCTVSFYVSYGGITKEDCYFTTIKNIDERIDGSPTYVVNNKGVSQEVIDQIDTNTDNIESLSTFSNNLREYDFVQKTRRAIVNFQFDDAILEGDTICKEIFDDFGYKCDFAVTSGIVNNADKMKAYLGFQNEGFHILSHSTDGNSMGSYENEADKQLKINKMLTSYNTLKQAGFDIHGWVTPSSSLHDDLYEPLAKIYDYGFGTGQSSSQYNYHLFGSEKNIAHMSRVGIESNLIKNTSKINKVQAYINSIWEQSITISDADSPVSIANVPFDTVIENAQTDYYDDAALTEDGALNDVCFQYLLEIWGVSTSDSTLTIDSINSTISLTPTFKICCEREGMKNIRTDIDEAIRQNAFISFYAHNTYSKVDTENGYGINLSKYTREILQYCQKVGVTVLNAKDAVKEYFSFRYTDFLDLIGRIEAIES